MKRATVLLGLWGLGATGQAADMLQEIDVRAPVEPAQSIVDPTADARAPAADAGEYLRGLPGVDGVRMGGHGIDPVIRGQSQTRLNVRLDGANVYGGCPNRMDPPTAYAPIDTYDRVEVSRGVRSLIQGAAPGGTVDLIRRTEPFAAGEHLRGRAGAGYQSNGARRNAFADVTVGGTQGYARFLGSYSDADDYEDGDGNEIASSFTETSGGAILGYVFDADSRIELGVEQNRVEDALYAGAGMDAPETQNDALRLKARDGIWSLELYRSEVEHLMDNYSLREPKNPMMLMRVPSDSDTTGGRLSAQLESGAAVWTVGLDAQFQDQDATRYNDANDSVNSVLWPGVELERQGLFAEVDYAVGERDTLRLGLRYDQLDSDATRAEVNPPDTMMATFYSPNELYALYYGSAARSRTERLWSALAGWERRLEALPGSLYLSLSSVARPADATERYIASNGSPDARWVGNPDLEAERHNQLDLGLSLQRRGWQATVSVFYDRVSDYILRDRAHGQDGILRTDSATVYRNVDATLWGGELAAAYAFTPAWRGELVLSYVHAENTRDERPIGQTPPLSGSLSLVYATRAWDLGARVRAAAEQNRVEDDPLTDSGVDAGPSDAYAVLDLFGRYSLGERLSLNYGVDNLFDRQYYNHLNKPNAFDTEVIQVAEPGRSFWVKASASF